METVWITRGQHVDKLGRERTKRRKAMETGFSPEQYFSEVQPRRERTKRRKAMETAQRVVTFLDLSMGRERTKRRKAMETLIPKYNGSKVEPRRERTKRRKAMETGTPCGQGADRLGVGNALNAERQWRRASALSALSASPIGRERTKRRKAMETGWRQAG